MERTKKSPIMKSDSIYMEKVETDPDMLNMIKKRPKKFNVQALLAKLPSGELKSLNDIVMANF